MTGSVSIMRYIDQVDCVVPRCKDLQCGVGAYRRTKLDTTRYANPVVLIILATFRLLAEQLNSTRIGGRASGLSVGSRFLSYPPHRLNRLSHLDSLNHHSSPLVPATMWVRVAYIRAQNCAQLVYRGNTSDNHNFRQFGQVLHLEVGQQWVHPDCG